MWRRIKYAEETNIALNGSCDTKIRRSFFVMLMIIILICLHPLSLTIFFYQFIRLPITRDRLPKKYILTVGMHLLCFVACVNYYYSFLFDSFRYRSHAAWNPCLCNKVWHEHNGNEDEWFIIHSYSCGKDPHYWPTESSKPCVNIKSSLAGFGGYGVQRVSSISTNASISIEDDDDNIYFAITKKMVFCILLLYHAAINPLVINSFLQNVLMEVLPRNQNHASSFIQTY